MVGLIINYNEAICIKKQLIRVNNKMRLRFKNKVQTCKFIIITEVYRYIEKLM